MKQLIAGKDVEKPTAYRQVKDAETGKWRRARPRERRLSTDRFRVQAQARLHNGELVTVDMVGKVADDLEDAAQKRLNTLIAASNPERVRPTATVGAIALTWLADPVRARLAESTRGLYAHSARRWLVPEDEDKWPAVARLMAHEVEPQDVTDWMHEVAVASGMETADTARSVLSNVFKYALTRRYVRSNPTRDAAAPDPAVVAEDRKRRAVPGTVQSKRPGPSADLDSERGFTTAELERVLIAFEVTPWAVDEDLFEVAMFLCGVNVRIGASLAALWDDLDLDGTAVWARRKRLDPTKAWFRTAEHTVTRVKGVGLVRTLYGATKRRERFVEVAPWLAEVLRERRARQGGRSEVVFDNPFKHGVLREVSRTTKLFRALFDSVLDDEGEPMTWASSHTFRRTGITRLDDAGVPHRVIADHSGHRRLQVLQDHYLTRENVSTVAAEHFPEPRVRKHFSDPVRDGRVKEV